VAELFEISCNLVSWVLLAGGCFFCITGGIGLIRFPDVYCRAHAAGLTDTLGAGLILVALMFQATSPLVVAKLFFILSFLALTSPTGTYALTRAAYSHGHQPQLDRYPADMANNQQDGTGSFGEPREGGVSSA